MEEPPVTRGPVATVRRLGINAHLVADDDGLTLIDTGLRVHVGAIRRAIAETGMPLRRIAITHAHPDHVGGLDRLVAAYPGVELLVSRREAKLLRGDRSPEAGEPADARIRRPLPSVGAQPTRLLDDGEAVGSLQVVASPGHSPGHVAFFDVRDGTLFAGDALATLGGLTTAARPAWPFPLLALVAWHRPTALTSVERLRALDPARLAVGHGRTLERPAAAIDRAIAFATIGPA
jgi:glyoxylase-like metal-dependent hydrolase (beta-lactamase superfamily II)